jgi:hypothetical protein
MKYAKAILAVVATVITAVVAMGGNGITPVEWVNVAIAGVGACAVFAAPNVPGALYTKSILAVLTAVLGFLTSAIVGGVSHQEWLQIIVLALGAVGVYAVPNKENGVNLSYTGSLGHEA